MECCCGICSCCNACCPGPRRRDKGYQQAPPMPYHNQYQYSQPPPMDPYLASGGAGGGYRNANVAQTATFESTSKNLAVSEDALPAMPSWSNATSRKVEQPHEQEDVEMNKMNRVASPISPLEQQQQAMLAKSNDAEDNDRYYGRPSDSHWAPTRGPVNANKGQTYHDYPAHQQFSPSNSYATGGHATQSGYFGSDFRTASPYSPHEQSYGSQMTGVVPTAQNWPQHSGGYANTGRTSPLSYAAKDGEFYEQQHQQRATYAPQSQYSHQSNYAQQEPYQLPTSYAQPKSYESRGPPSYRTQAPSEIVSPISPPPLLTPGGGNVNRKPVGGNWREV